MGIISSLNIQYGFFLSKLQEYQNALISYVGLHFSLNYIIVYEGPKLIVSHNIRSTSSEL